MNVKDKIYYGTIDDIIKALRRVPNRDNDEIIHGQWKFEKTPIFENDQRIYSKTWIGYNEPISPANGDTWIKGFEVLFRVGSLWVKLQNEYPFREYYKQVNEQSIFETRFDPIPTSVRIYVNGLLRKATTHDNKVDVGFDATGTVSLLYRSKISDIGNMILYYNDDLVIHENELIINDIL